jgi:hypothetical protein
VLHTAAELLLAEVLLEHAQQRAALLVREHVEHALAVVGCLHRVLDGAGGHERIGLERGTALEAERGPPLPVGAVGAQHSTSMNVANASFSQMPFHQLIVTRSPNHMWASSWVITSASTCSSAWVLCASSTSSRLSR